MRQGQSIPQGCMSRPREFTVLALYTATIFVSATLLFLIQPLFARMVLPLLGGAPAVWNTAMVFYQAMLLAGYSYAHFSTRLLGERRQAMLHVALLFLPLLALPIGIPAGWTPPTASNPIPWLLTLLLVGVGLPFFVVSTSSPLLQRWFARTGHRAAADPYFLYAASNLGSMLALASYPLLFEPHLRLHSQSWIWTIGYGLLVVLTTCCAFLLRRAPVTDSRPASISVSNETARISIDWPRRIRWILLAFAPSSLMLSVTTYLSTDIAAVPLLWIIPLALYLLTYILVFASKPLLPHHLMARAFPIVLLPLIIVIVARANQPVSLLIPLHLLTFFVATMVCHGELARSRPDAHHLTEFYLWMSVGGVLGGIFNALLAPLLFDSVIEYPLTLVLVCLLSPRLATSPTRRLSPRTLDVVFPLSLAGLTLAMIAVAGLLEVSAGPLSTGMMFGLPTLLCFSFSRRPVRFGLGVAAVLLAGALHLGPHGQVLYSERSFFGVHRVTLAPNTNAHMLMHGSTLHGMQSLEPEQRLDPLTYYYQTGPVGQAFSLLPQARSTAVGVVGMGTGSITCYGQPGQQWTLYEIDPAVERIARDTRFFTFLRDCPPDKQVVLGDARLSLKSAADHQYGMLILDAYSSDAIPLHLVSREALQLYLAKVADDGVLLFHISNRHLDLEPVLTNLAEDAGLASRIIDDGAISQEDATRGKTASKWFIMARQSSHLGALATDPRAQVPRGQIDAGVWTDDFSSLLSVFKWE